MIELSTEDIRVVSTYPVGGALESFRQLFHSTCKLGVANCLGSIERVVSSQDGTSLARRLISALLAHEAAQELPSKVSNTTLSDDLATIYPQVRFGEFDIYWIIPLCKLVIDKASDIAIWKAVFGLIAEATRPPTTPHSGFTSSVKDTPNSFNSSSFQNTSEPAEKVKAVLKGELDSNLELDHNEFNGTYLVEIPQVDDAATTVFKKCCEGDDPLYKIGDGWGSWEDHDEKGVQRSLEEHISVFMKFLDEADIKPPSQRRFVPSPNTPIPGSVKRKPDLCVATYTGETISVPAKLDKRIASWSQVLVAFELKPCGKDGLESTWLDIVKYAREIFRHQDSRRFVLGVTLCGSTMRLWEFDRLGATTSKPFNIHKNGFFFVKTLFSFLWMNNEQLGFDPDLMEVDGQRFVKVNRDGKEERLIITEILKGHTACIAGRATTCWRAYCEGDKSKKPFVVKDSWQYVDRPEEGELVRKATIAGATNIAQYYHHETIYFNGKDDSIRSNVRKDMSTKETYNPLVGGASQATSLSKSVTSRRASSFFSEASSSPKLARTLWAKSSNSANQGSQASRKRPSSQIEALEPPRKRSRSTMTARDGENILAKDRVRRRIITQRVGKPLRNASCPAAILTGILGGIKGHESLYKAGVLHRDVSPGNILLEEDESDGFLIDLDLAVDLNRLEASGAPGKTGTKVFMAIGALDGDAHSFMHDLESFFWVLFWICVHYTGPGNELQDVGDFQDWNYESTKRLALLKSGLISQEKRFNEEMSVFSTVYCKDLIPCVKELWKIIFPGGKGWTTENYSLYSSVKAVLEKAGKDLITEEVV
ncbi:MAG: hypothetical protein Q9163_006361 [Psora crenata]